MLNTILNCVKGMFYHANLFFQMIYQGVKPWFFPHVDTCSHVKVKGKVVLVTGGNAGIGLETARDLARRGATVIIASRDEKKSEAAVADIIATTGNANVNHKYLDLSKFSSIREFAEDFNRTYNRLDILINNAGCAGLPPTLTEDGIERVTQINYFGPFLLTNLLLDKVIASKPSRIVILSSSANEAHELDPDDLASLKKVQNPSKSVASLFKTYANTKLCNILWAKALAKRVPEGVTVNAVHPGIVATDIYQEIPVVARKIALWFINAFFKTPEEGAKGSVYLSVAPELEGVTGEYFADYSIASADKLTKDDEMIERVWDNTMKLINAK